MDTLQCRNESDGHQGEHQRLYLSWHYKAFQVLVKNPMPEKVKRDGSFEDTMMLLEMIKEKQQKENKQMKACFKFSARQMFI